MDKQDWLNDSDNIAECIEELMEEERIGVKKEVKVIGEGGLQSWRWHPHWYSK
jgi:hypothetical protein